MEYRVNFILSLFAMVVPLAIQYFFWTAMFESSVDKVISGYTYHQMLVYTIMAGVISKIISTGFEQEIASDIKNGGLSRYLVQPINYIMIKAAGFLGSKSVQLMIMTIIIAVLVLFFNSYLGFDLNMMNMLAFLITMLLAIFLNFFIFFCISTLAFWMTDTWGVFSLASIAISIVSGGVIPLDMLGAKMMTLFDFTPFKNIQYFSLLIR